VAGLSWTIIDDRENYKMLKYIYTVPARLPPEITLYMNTMINARPLVAATVKDKEDQRVCPVAFNLPTQPCGYAQGTHVVPQHLAESVFCGCLGVYHAIPETAILNVYCSTASAS